MQRNLFALLEFEPLVFQSLWIALAVIAIVFTGSIVQAGLGMGFGLTVAPILALLDPVLVPICALYLGMATSIAGAWNERANIVWREVNICISGRILGILVGLYILLGLTSINACIRADNVGGLAFYSKQGFQDHSVDKDVPLKDGTRVDRVNKRFSL